MSIAIRSSEGSPGGFRGPATSLDCRRDREDVAKQVVFRLEVTIGLLWLGVGTILSAALCHPSDWSDSHCCREGPSTPHWAIIDPAIGSVAVARPSLGSDDDYTLVGLWSARWSSHDNPLSEGRRSPHHYIEAWQNSF